MNQFLKGDTKQKKKRTEIEVICVTNQNVMDQLHMNYDPDHVGLLKKNKTQRPRLP